LIRYKFRWAEADDEPQDNQLTISEMQDFRHPEQSSKMIVQMAKDIIDNLGICLCALVFVLYIEYITNFVSIFGLNCCCNCVFVVLGLLLLKPNKSITFVITVLPCTFCEYISCIVT